MKILIIHNDYGRYSGEEAVVDKTAEMFRQLGHEVAFFRMTSVGHRDSLVGNIRGFFCGMYSPQGVKGMRKALIKEKPDVVNVHNLYPFISPVALFECRKRNVPVVMTVHNFRIVCPTGLFMRNDKPCELCLNRGNEWSCLRHNCEQSLFRTVGFAARNAVARMTGAYRKCVTRFACITEFQRQKLIEAGFEGERIAVIPNSIEVPTKPIDGCESMNSPARWAPPQEGEGGYVAYLGRISHEKGYDLLCEVARRHPEIEFRFAGDLREEVVMPELPNIKLMGYLKGKALEQYLDACRFLVIPSRCYEGFPMSILEAALHGKPSIGPDHGGFTEIIGKGEEAIGRLFEPGSVDDLERQITTLWNAPERCRELGRKAYEKLQSCYSTEVTQRQWAALLQQL
jgi:glycosyltransferase involved in cell wall biosynthesis